MAKKKKTKETKKRELKDTIFQWTNVSNSGAAGMRAVYSTVLYPDGVLTCNCPGWVFSKGGVGEKRCKHTVKVSEEAVEVLKKFKKGEALPSYDMADPALVGLNAEVKKNIASGAKFGRTIRLD